jgi:hypothetical protein
LQKVNEILGARLNTWHNLHYYLELMEGLRGAIEQGRLARVRRRVQGGARRAFSIMKRDDEGGFLRARIRTFLPVAAILPSRVRST